MEEYKSNSHASREKEKNQEKKEIKKVISGHAKTKKKSGIRKLADAFISEDAGDIKSYLWNEIFIPQAKDTILNTIDMILNGNSGRYKRRGNSSRISYQSFYDRGRQNKRSEKPQRYDYDDIIIDDRGEAEEVLDLMNENIDIYGIVTVSDLYSMVGITTPYTYNNYGWKDLRTASIVRVNGGYMLKLPRAIPLD